LKTEKIILNNGKDIKYVLAQYLKIIRKVLHLSYIWYMKKKKIF